MTSESRKINSQFTPADFQKPLPISKIISKDTPSEEKVEFDVVFIGAGLASLSGAIKLAHLVKSENDKTGGKLGEIAIGVLEKSAEIGNHILSGAVIKPQPFLELFPDLTADQLPFRSPVKSERVYFLTSGKAIRIPVPPPMNNHGNYIASLSEVTRWMAEKAEGLGVQVFTGFPAESLLVRENSVIGIKTAETGLERDGSKSHNYQPATAVTGKVIVLGEGTRGSLTQAYLEWQNVGSENPQIYALGIKEIWQTTVPLDSVVHSMGWPLPRNVFGGSFMYPLERNLIALGLVVGLDYENANLDCHFLFQQMKTHPFFRKYLENGEMVEWGAKTIPEGGFYSIPSRLTGDGVVIIGDSAGFVDVPSLKGIHYAVKSGMLAAEAVFDALKKKDYSQSVLSQYDKAIKVSFISKDLWKRRNMRLVFKQGFYTGSFKAGLMHLTGGRFPGKRIAVKSDSEEARTFQPVKKILPDGKLTFGKVEGVFRSGNATRDSIPSHILAGENIPTEVAEFYANLCPAGVYEVVDGKLRINPPNCIDCKATDILAGRWSPREGGSGPKYKRM